MKFRQALKISSLCCFAGTVVGGYLGSLIYAIWLNAESGTSLQQWLMTPLTAAYFLLFAAGFAVLPVTALGWPIYAWLIYSGRAPYWAAVAIAIGFALSIWALVGGNWAALVGLLGTCIAVATHSALPRASRLANSLALQ